MRREFFFSSCWRASDDESEAMWQRYCPSGQGVAIQTTYAKLRDSLPDHTHIGLVSYIDHD